MSEDFGPDIIEVTDDDGVTTQLEVLDFIDYNGQTYGAFLPADMSEDDPDFGMVILRVVEQNGEELFEDIESDEELNEVYEKFMIILFGDEE